MQQVELTQAIYRALVRALMVGVAVYAAIQFADAVTAILLFFLLAIVLSIALTPAVNWLEGRRVPRPLAAVLVVFAVVAAFAGLAALVAPRLTHEVRAVSQQIPTYSRQLEDRVEGWMKQTPGLPSQLDGPAVLEQLLPSASTLLARVGRYTVTAVGVAVGLLVLVALVIYMVASPRALLRGMLTAVPLHLRDPFARAFGAGSQTVVRWMWANLIIGAIEAVVTIVALSLLGIPGAFLWGVVVFFAELIPQFGSYLMAVPPLIVALAVDPPKAVWVLVFFVALQQFTNNVLAPPIRSRTMRIHPVSEIFMVLALTFAFGVFGAILADPVVGFVKAFYDEFYAAKNPEDEAMGERVEALLQGELSPASAPPSGGPESRPAA